MEILLSGLIFSTVTILIWGLYLIFTDGEKEARKRLGYYVEVKPNNLPFTLELEEKKFPQHSIFSRVTARLEKKDWTQRLEIELQKADISLKGSEMAVVYGIMSLVGFSLGWLLFGLGGCVMGGIVGYSIPLLFIKCKQKNRLNKFNRQINDSLVLVSNSLKAGYSFFQAIDLLSKEMAPPISREFARVLKEINLGASIEEALKDMVERVSSDDMDMVIQAVMIQRQVGGNLAEVLDKIAYTIRERIRIRAEIKTLTAQGKMSGIIIALLPIGLGLLMSLINPDYFSLLWTTPAGRVFIGIALILDFLGVIIIRRIINIKI